MVLSQKKSVYLHCKLIGGVISNGLTCNEIDKNSNVNIYKNEATYRVCAQY